jgi:uncharacterized protein
VSDLDTDIEPDADSPDGDTASPGSPARTPKRFRKTANWTRWLHVYTSMISLLVVLFFGLTGITLNHPSWTLGDDPTTTEYTGTLPDGWNDGGTIDFLAISEFARSEYGVHGEIGDYGTTGDQGTITYKAAGYAADLFFDTDTGEYTLTVSELGWVAVMNDVHKGRDTSSSWKWAIDLSAGLLVVVAVTGLGIQVFQKKRRRRALAFAAAFTVLSIVWILIARN